MIRHVFTNYEPPDDETRRRNRIAQQTWQHQPWIETPVADADLPQMWNENGRTFPYLCDVFDVAAKQASDRDRLAYTNADIHVHSDLCAQLQKIFEQTEACYAYRRDFHKLDAPLSDEDYHKGTAYVGSDLAACTVRWWREHGHKLRGMILGAEAWDPMFRQLADETNPGRVTCLKDVIGHERHASYWERRENRYTLEMQRQSVATAWRFFAARGIDPATRWISLEGFAPDESVVSDMTCDLIVLGLGRDADEIKCVLTNLAENLADVSWKCFVCAPDKALPAVRAHAQVIGNLFTVNEPPKLPLRRRTRYARMATLRNQVLRVFRNSGIQAKAILWVDMDCYGFWQAREPIAQLLAREDWDAVAAYGLMPLETCGHDVATALVSFDGRDWVYYDWLAYEDADSRRVLWHSHGKGHYFSHGKVPAEVTFTAERVAAVNGTRVNSAFGPACFYRPEAITGLWYDENTEQCEHQAFHAAMRQRGQDRLFIAEDVVALYESPVFKAQCGEDLWLAEHWDELGLPEHGFFVDVGAADGRTFSNTHWLEKVKGWRGLLIEPDPRHEIKDRNAIVERVAIGPRGTISLGRTADPFLNSVLRESDIVGEPRLAVQDRIDVASVPLTSLLDIHGIDRVDLLSIDTEGTEIEAWRTLDLSRWRPQIVIAEYSTWELNDDLEGLKAEFAVAGYELLHATNYNGIFRDAR